MKSYTAIRLGKNSNGMGPARNSALVSMCVWSMYVRVTKEGDDILDNICKHLFPKRW